MSAIISYMYSERVRTSQLQYTSLDNLIHYTSFTASVDSGSGTYAHIQTFVRSTLARTYTQQRIQTLSLSAHTPTHSAARNARII